jgi:MFS family permease
VISAAIRTRGAEDMAASIETRASWTVAFAALAILSVAYGAPLVVVVALRPIAETFAAAEAGPVRSVPALASSLTYLGVGVGGVLMGWLAGRVGTRPVATAGGLMVGAGLALSAGGAEWQLVLGHGLLVGLLGIGALYGPLMTYVSMWFDRRRGTALALVSSGLYVAGAVWPTVFERSIAAFGWRPTMLAFGLFASAAIAPLAALVLRPPPTLPAPGARGVGPAAGGPVLGLRPGVAHTLLAAASFLCCVPMAMPAAHLVAHCGDLGISARHGAAMLSVLLVAAFASRQLWGWVSDRIGGVNTVLAGSACQTAGMALFLATQDEAGLFAVSAAFGLGFGGIVPAYVLAVRELFPAAEASWRVPALLFMTMSGMATGSWLAGALYDRLGSYAPAFAAGIAANLLNLAVVGFLAARQDPGKPRPPVLAPPAPAPR